MDDLTQKKELIILVTIFLCAFTIRLYFMQHREVIDFDGVYYGMLGKNLVSGKGYIEPEGIYQWYYPPFYPVQIGFMWLLIGDVEAAGEWISLIYGSLLPLLLFFLAKKLNGINVAFLAAILSALYIPYIEFSSSVTADINFIFLTVLSFFILFQ